MNGNLRWGGIVLGIGLLVTAALRTGIIDASALIGTGAGEPMQLTSTAEFVQGAPADEPAFRVIYQLGRSNGRFGMSRAVRVINQSGILATAVERLNRELVLRRDVLIRARACGTVNAFYYPHDSSIDLCQELFDVMSVLFDHYEDEAAFRDAVLGATLFFFMHEVGHALVDQFELPVLVGEENAADGLATYLLAESGLSGVAYRGAESFGYMAMHRQPGVELPFWDEHAIDEQRFYNISCWLFGAESGRYAFLVSSGLLPLARAERCPAEYVQLQTSASRMLAPYRRG